MVVVCLVFVDCLFGVCCLFVWVFVCLFVCLLLLLLFFCFICFVWGFCDLLVKQICDIKNFFKNFIPDLPLNYHQYVKRGRYVGDYLR